MTHDKVSFDISGEVLSLSLTGVYLAFSGIRNKNSDPEFDTLQSQVVEQLRGGISTESLTSDPVLQGFRRLHDAVGCSNRKNVSSPENLLLFLLKSGRLPRINLLVDIYNLVSMETRLALGAHDLARVAGNIHLKLTTGTEKFWPLGAAEPKPIKAGEYAYVDDANDVICRLEVRQVEKTKVDVDTTDCFYIIQGNAATDATYLKNAAERLVNLTKRFCGGQERVLYAPWGTT